MNNFLILTNERKDPEFKLSKKMVDYINGHGGSAICMDSFTHNIQEPFAVPDHVECVIVMGGDGTMLHAARLIVDHDLPMVGVNLGTLGFLTEIEPDSLLESLDRLMNDDYVIEERMMLSGRVFHDGKETYVLRALNDAVITRSGFSRIISFRIYVNGTLLDRYEADGVIFSTPTGSTGYNLSAGGPVVNPRANVILITPVCVHSFHAKSIVLDPSDQIEVFMDEIRKNDLEEAFVTFDGQVAQKLGPGDSLQITVSKKAAKIIKVNGDNFYHTLRVKVGGKE